MRHIKLLLFCFILVYGTCTAQTRPSVLDVAPVLYTTSLYDIKPTTSEHTIITQGHSQKDDGGAGVWFWEATSTATSNVGTVICPTGHTGNGRWLREYSGPVNVRWFGAKGGGTTDDYAALVAAIAAADSVYAPKGTYHYGTPLVLEKEFFTLNGDGSNKTIFQYTGEEATAFTVGSTTAFIQGINLSNLTIKGNASTSTILAAYALARCRWEDIQVAEAAATNSVGFSFNGCSLNRLVSLFCSNDYVSQAVVPDVGCEINALAPFGNSSNNTYISCYFEGDGTTSGMLRGLRILGGTQNTFVGGSSESCYQYGVLVGPSCNFNTFIGVGFENLNSTADISDEGNYTKYLNCYSSQGTIIQGNGTVIDGGFYELVDIQSIASGTTVQNITLNHWDTGGAGFIDAGFNTRWHNLYDSDLGTNIYPTKEPVGLSFVSTLVPFVWANDSGRNVDLILNSGAVTNITITRNGSAFQAVPGVPSITRLAPNDIASVTFSATPTSILYLPE